MIKINDPRTTVTEIFLEECKYTDGTRFFVAYKAKGDAARIVNVTGPSFTSLQRVDEDHVKALAENGIWYTYTIGKDRVWEDILATGFTKEKNATSRGKESGAKSSSGKKTSSNKDGCFMQIIKAPFKLLWWIIKTVFSIIF